MEFQRIRRDLKAALEGQGVRADAVLKNIGGLKDMEQKMTSMERMAMEMQQKVITLQQERDGLEEKLMRGAPLSLNAEVERRQNLELKEEITRLTQAEEECRSENSLIRKQLEESENLCISLQEQIKEFLAPSGQLGFCSTTLLGSSEQNKTDIQKAGEENMGSMKILGDDRSTQTDKISEPKKREKKSRSRSREKERAEIQALTQKLKTLQEHVKKLEVENLELFEKASRASNDSSSDEEDPLQPLIKHKPKPKVKTLERQLQVLHSENLRLTDKLGGYSPGSRLDPDEVIERIVELEDFCSDLQDRVREAEGHERQVREKLRLAEQTINELENSEAQYRDKCDELSQLERETKKQLHSLQTTGRELREIILDKDILEQALKEKVEFLEKVEAQSSQRITELESLEKSLREQLESRDSANGDHHNHSLKAKLTAAEQEIKQLREQNSELEENEEILRENWRRVADEDANRLMCLEEKVRLLDLANHDLKNKLSEAQDFVVINSAPAQGSLADELSASRRGPIRAHSESPMSGGSDDESSDESPRKMVGKLKRQLSFLEEEKNGKIANLQERLAEMKENEIKLSETLAEMEMTERELRAKLALYESSEVTVEKMLRYQDKIDELRTSQESLLDQLETMESQEVTLQERLEETERRLKGKIVTLEVEMKNLKQKELKGNARIRELEKHEEELTEKTQKQAEKENGLYVRISGLMDQVKEHKTKISELEKKLEEKDERCRKVASLETKFLQIEVAYREKITTLESSLEEAQSSLVEQQNQHKEQVSTLEDSLQSKDKQHQQRVFILEEMFAQKEKELNERISSLENSVTEKERTIFQHDQELGSKADHIADLEKELSGMDSKINELESVVNNRHLEEDELAKDMSLKDDQIRDLEKDLSERDTRISQLEKELSDKESYIGELDKDQCERETRVSDLEEDNNNKQGIIARLEKELSEQVSRNSELEDDLNEEVSRIAQMEEDLKESLEEKDSQISELKKDITHLETDFAQKNSRIAELENEVEDRTSQVSQLERDLGMKGKDLGEMEKDLSDKDSHIQCLETEISERNSHVQKLETELEDKCSQIGDLEAKIVAKDQESSEAQELIENKDNHIAQMEERIIDMSSTISQLHKEVAEKDSDLSSLEKQLTDKDAMSSENISQLQTELQSKQKSSTDRISSLEDELVELKTQLSQSKAALAKSSKKVVEVESELEEERSKVESLRHSGETALAERDLLQSQLSEKDLAFEAQLKEKENEFQSRLSVRESEFHQACASLDAECDSLRAELIEKDTVIEKLESNKNELLSKIENLKDREKDLANKLAVLDKDLNNLYIQKEEEKQEALLVLENRLKDSEHGREAAERKVSATESDLHCSSQTIQQQLEEIMELKSAMNKAKVETETLQDKLSELQSQEARNSAQAEVYLQQEVMLKSRMSEVEGQLEASSKDKEEQEANISNLLQQKQDLEEALHKVETNLSDSHTLNAQLQDTVSQLTADTKALQKEVADSQDLMTSHQKQQQEIQTFLEQERSCVQELESEISCLKDENQSSCAEAARLQRELELSQESVEKLEAQISMMSENEESLKSQILSEQTARQEVDHRLNQVSSEVSVSQETSVQLEKAVKDKDEEIVKLKEELCSQKQVLEVHQNASLNIEQKDQELQKLAEREVLLQEKMATMENQMERHQDDHSQMCQKLQELERREKELLEQITDIEQSVIIPLETENSELREEVMCMKQQNEALNLQVDKLEEQTREDSEELEELQKSVNDLQLCRRETQSKLDKLIPELHQQELENERLHTEVVDLEALNKNLEQQLENRQVELDKIELEFHKECFSQDCQTDLDVQAVQAELSHLQEKLTVLQDAESKFMSRILDLEEHEEQLTEQLESTNRRLQEQDQQGQVQTDDTYTHSQTSYDFVDASVDTEGLQEPNTAKVPELFARVQELETANQKLSLSLEQATAGEVDRKQLTDKLHLLEQSEDRLMERIMELEENEVALRTQIERFRHRAKAADELEEEVSVLLQQEDEWKSENSALSQKVEGLQNQCDYEQSRNEKLTHQIETEQKHLQDVQKELSLVQAKLQSVRSEYEEKLSALEESEKKIENQLDNQSQRESDLRQEMKVLREEMEDVCERYKELEQENSSLKQQQSNVLSELKDAETRCLQLAGGVSREPTMQAVQAQTAHSAVPLGANVSRPQGPAQQQSPPQVCSNLSVQTVQLPKFGAHDSNISEDYPLTRNSQQEKELTAAYAKPLSVGVSSPTNQGNIQSSESFDSDSSGVVSSSVQSVKMLTLHDVLEENAALKAQIQDLQSSSQQFTQQYSASAGSGDGSGKRLSGEQLSAETLHLQAEISRLQSRIVELEKSVQEAEGAVQEVVTVVRTRSVHTLEQKIETIQRTIHTQSPAWSLNQELLELLTSQADLQKQVSHLMETEHNLRSALKQVEDELARTKSGAGATSLGSRRFDADRRLGVQSRLSRFGGGLSSTRTPSETDKTPLDSSKKAKEQWLERQVADLQLAKTNLERRLHEAERRLAFRPRPTSASRDELLFRIDQLQEEQGQWRKKVEDLEALNSHYLKEKLELASERACLEQKLQEQGSGILKEVNTVFVGGTREEPLGSSGSVSEGEPSADPDTDPAMLEKPEDVLHKRIKELENLESYLRQQLSEVESDREQLHEIARKDKAMIHEQNVRIRELMLQERNLRSQVTGLEDSERSLYNRSSELEDKVSRLEDRVHELEVHERRLRELVRKLKLDEEVWLSKSGDLTASMEQLSTSEVSLRKLVQDLQIEKGGLSDRAEYLEVRVKELESLESALVQRLKNYENVEASLQSRLQHTENAEAAANSKASELDVINLDLSARLQRAVEENAVLSQHVAQQQGQIHEMDRKLSAASDAQVGMSQHVESLQKNEASLQKKVREYELRDIDAQARVRELEQTEEILKDKVNQLQRSENRLKSRLVEFETVGSQVLENMPPAQKQQLPQKLEDCQKRVVVLQRQLEAAQAELHRPHVAEDDATSVKVPTAALREMRSKVALLEESEYQMSELEKLNAQLRENIQQLQQGKGSCGHEVELDVLNRRLHSYQNCIQNLKHHLSEGQVPSLWAADIGQGPESEDLPARSLQSLESERVLQSVRSLTKPPGLSHVQEEIVQAHSGALQAGRAQGLAAVPSEPEESHWRTVELRRGAQQEAELRGASASLPPTSVTSTALPHQEELMIGLSLPSESERGSFKSQNDTDSEKSGISHPHLRMVGSTQRGPVPTPDAVPSSGRGGRTDVPHPPMPSTTTWPPPATPYAQQQRSNAGFVTDDSFYLPSSAQSELESQEEGDAPPLPSSAPPGLPMSAPPSLPPSAPSSAGKSFVSAMTLPSVGELKGARTDSVGSGDGPTGQKGRARTTPLQPTMQTTSAVGLSIRQRIAQIERQLKDNPSAKAGSKAEDEDVFTWKAKATENARLQGVAERESKQMKEDLPPAARRREKINKLEKDLEEKRRYIYIIEKWILDAEEMLKNKNKKNDRDLVQQLQTEVKHLKQDLGNAGYRKDDIFTDPAALKTELEHKDRELNAKRSELEGLTQEMQHWRLECSNIETMRKNALDALRLLETEVTQLQDADIQLKQMKDEYNTLRGQYEDVWKKCQDLNQTLSTKEDLEFKLKRAALECNHLKSDLAKVIEERDDLEPKLHELRTKVRNLANVEAENASLESQVSSLNKSLKERTDKMREVYEENVTLHERLAELQLRLDKLRETRRDLDNMCARFDEVDIQKNKAVATVHTLRAKVARLAKKCQEKDEVLHRLSEELRGSRGRSGSLMEELTRLEALAGGEEYNRPLSPLDLVTGPAMSDTERLLSERIPHTSFTRWPSTSSLGDPRDLAASTDLLRSNERLSLRRPRSADQAKRGQHASVTSSQSLGIGNSYGYGRESLCVAILDYQPEASSRSGHRHLELPLKEGDQVRIKGPVDRHGYCEAEVGGRTGLVPASHLYPLTDSTANYRTASHMHGRPKKSGGDSAEQIVQMFDELQDARLMSGLTHNHSAQTSQHAGHSTATQTHQRRSVTKSHAAPEAPTNLHIQEVDGNNLVLAWQPPILDQHGCSNGCKVVGYRIYLNGRVCQQPHTPRLSRTMVEGLRHDRPQQLAIQTLAASGQTSARVELVYQGFSAPAQDLRKEDGETDTDLSSILNSIQYKTGRKRTVMGLYDYDPEKQSPGDYTACELAFHAGDLLLVYGEERQDGFFHGEKNGQRGLVPACFVEPVTQGIKSTQKQSPANGSASPRS